MLTNLRAALDHTFWTAVMAHSGPPPNPHLVTFPLATENSKNFKGKAKDLRPLVAPEFWDLVEACQPFQAEQPQDMPLEWLRWLSNADKHRAVRVIGQMAFDAGPIVFTEGEPFEIVDEKRFTGPVEDNAVVARVKIKRPVGARTITLRPTFAYSPALQVGEDAELIVPLHVVMEEMTQDVLVVISNATTVLGEELPDPAGLEVGTEHASVAAENSGVSWFFRDYDGTSHRMDVPAGEAQTGSQE
ncbi:hypothetical protein [Amycolatopsis rubida]|uniref:hypothetical protein n=1 Tax=Amycolatopsis rubida TaxID=112413 RepID=UPI001FCBF97B|nr:hypothetical protein [Amycolatopsis rubida]